MITIFFNIYIFLQNKSRALQVLRARLYDIQRQKVESERTEARRKQVSILRIIRGFFGRERILCILKKEYTEKSLLYLLPSNEKYPNNESKRIEFLSLF